MLADDFVHLHVLIHKCVSGLDLIRLLFRFKYLLYITINVFNIQIYILFQLEEVVNMMLLFYYTFYRLIIYIYIYYILMCVCISIYIYIYIYRESREMRAEIANIPDYNI